MKVKINRRDFLQRSSKISLAGCAILMGGINTMKGASFLLAGDEIPNPAELCYCGYKCPEDCKLKMASVENNDSLKRVAYGEWKIKERHGIDFDPDKVICFGCKTKDKPMGIVLQNCTVRACAIEKNLECCIACKELKECKKELWDRFPDFKKYVIEIQGKYLASKTN